MVTLNLDDAGFDCAAGAAFLFEFFAECFEFVGGQGNAGYDRDTFAFAALAFHANPYDAIAG